MRDERVAGGAGRRGDGHSLLFLADLGPHLALRDASGERLRYNSRQVRRGALLAAPDAAAPRLIKGFRAATDSSAS